MTLRYNPLDPDFDLLVQDEEAASGVRPLDERLEELLSENRVALRPPAMPTLPDLETLRARQRVPVRAVVANVLEDVGVWWARGYWGFVKTLRGGA